MTEEYLMSQEKKNELEQELQRRKVEVRPEIAERVQFARSLGDLKENSEYHIAREEQGKNESRIQEIEALLKYARIVTKEAGDHIQLSSQVTIHKVGDDTLREFVLVSATEADMAAGKLSCESPIGQALMGAAAGDTVTVDTAQGPVEWYIKKVS
ncbi:MAG: transcription elongation factor GreA [Candidatus Pacebacteria bacterium]|nr:transcription elongation factor GreA [Candidatus Paceibacterota bacterium]MCD8507932.1 transcription elongation factor GreA [Candidatus Paceibacterota bacterium]MCD8528145.1 transcription elongation factor GreA [Candidatus Paceibacterota bacterium]MCD8563660.1 transcription elongation factor GreA [Candidatus Paceibacterota bacterium]